MNEAKPPFSAGPDEVWDRLYHYTDGEWKPYIPPNVIGYDMQVTTHLNGAIMVELREAERILSSWLVNTRDKAIRQALIKLGWTPPVDECPSCGRDVQTEPCPCGNYLSQGTGPGENAVSGQGGRPDAPDKIGKGNPTAPG